MGIKRRGEKAPREESYKTTSKKSGRQVREEANREVSRKTVLGGGGK